MADQKVRTSTRLWSQEVALANSIMGRGETAGESIAPTPESLRAEVDATYVYEFGNGRRFTAKGPYG